MKLRHFVRIACAAAAMFGCASVHAQGLFRAYLSVTGSDANACTVVAPCRLLPAALAAVADGGEIWILTSANYNTAEVAITKSVSILAVPGVVGSLIATGSSSALHINTADVRVSLRNLVILSSGAGSYGIRFLNGAALRLADCEITGIPGDGIFVIANATVDLRNTVIRGSDASGLDITNGRAVLSNVHLLDNQTGLSVGPSASATVTRSVISGNALGARVDNNFDAAAGTTARLAIDRSVVTNNVIGVQAATHTGDATTTLAISRSTLSRNSLYAIDVIDDGPGTAYVIAALTDNNQIVDNGTGINISGGPLAVVRTRSNNTARYNSTDVAGGTLTEMSGQ